MLDLRPLAEARITAPLVAISMARTSDTGETPHRGRAKGNPFMSGGWEPVRAEHTNDDLVVTAGAIPAGLSGSFVRTGPNPRFPEKHDPRSYHFFAGDAMVHGSLSRVAGRLQPRASLSLSAGFNLIALKDTYDYILQYIIL